MTLGIFTPYQLGEVTTAALRLADLGLSLSGTVKLLAPGRIEKVHPFWDDKVLSCRGDNPYVWAKDCTSLVFFQHDRGILEKTKLVAEDARRVFVPMWHQLTPAEVQDDWPYRAIVGPGMSVTRHIGEVVFGGETSIHLLACPWSAGIDPVKRTSEVNHEYVSVYVGLDSVTMDETGPFVLRVCEEMLKTYPRVRFTLDCGKSWPKQSRKELKRLSEAHPGRLWAIYRTDLLKQQEEYHLHDWAWFPATRWNTCVYAHRALSCGTPVIANDVPPLSESVKHETHGLLTECELTPSWMEAPIACPSLNGTFKALRRVMEDDILEHCRSQEWKLPVWNTTFLTFWANTLGVDLS